MSAVDVILDPYEPVELTIDLPFPVSTNRIWGSGRGRVFRSKAYRQWLTHADQQMLVGKFLRGHSHTISTPFEAQILLSSDYRTGDADNRIKCVLDYAQSRKLISNDNLAQKVTVEWVLPNHAPVGCRLVLKELT